MTSGNKKITIQFDDTLSEKININNINIDICFKIDNTPTTSVVQKSNTVGIVGIVDIVEKEKELTQNEIIAYLEQHYATLDSVDSQIIDCACIEGRLDIIKWFHKNFKSSKQIFTYKAMNYAAEHGRLDVVKWLYENWSELSKERIMNAMNLAAKNERSDVLNYLYLKSKLSELNN